MEGTAGDEARATTARPVRRPVPMLLGLGAATGIALTIPLIGAVEPASVGVLLVGGLAALAATVVAIAVSSQRQRRRFEESLAAWAAERAAADERRRIARELHDLASHGIGLITVRAVAARTEGSGDAERSAALADIEAAARETMRELRRLLLALRVPEDEVPLRPSESFADLPAIVDAARRAGVEARIDVRGEASAGAQLLVCTVLRECFANTARHAGPVLAEARVRRQGDALVVCVRDTGPAPGWTAQEGAGHGLAVLRERLALLGGTVAAGPGEQGGWLVTARIPEAA